MDITGIATLFLLVVIAAAVCVILYRQHKGPAWAQDAGGKAQAVIADVEAAIAKHKSPAAPPPPPATGPAAPPAGATGAG